MFYNAVSFFFSEMNLIEGLFQKLDVIETLLKVGTKLTHFYQSGDHLSNKALF